MKKKKKVVEIWKSGKTTYEGFVYLEKLGITIDFELSYTDKDNEDTYSFEVLSIYRDEKDEV